MTIRAENLRELIKDILKGKKGTAEFLNAINHEKEDHTLLTDNERRQVENYNSRHSESSFESFSIEDLLLYSLIRYKAKPTAPRRHLLDRIDLTTVTGEDAETAYRVTNQPWISESDDKKPACLKE